MDGLTKPEAWPPRPTAEIFPEILDSLLVAQFLSYDRRGQTTEQARRNVRKLVKESKLPVLKRRIGSALWFRKSDVLAWLSGSDTEVDAPTEDATVSIT